MLGPEMAQKAIEIAVDLGKGYVLERITEPAFTATWEVVKSIFLPRWDGARDALQLNLQEAIDRERTRDAEFTDRLKRSFENGEANAVAALFIREAAQATTDERMRMLAEAAAGVFTPDLTSEMRSRIARAVAQLEPSDVLALRRFAQPHGGAIVRTSSRTAFLARGARMRSATDSEAALLAAGCLVLVQDQTPPFLSKEKPPEWQVLPIMTPVGRAVLNALREWTPSSGPSAPEPQGDSRPGS